MVLTLLLMAVGILSMPTAGAFLIERGRRAAWGIVHEGWQAAGEGAYREVRVSRRSPGRAPASVIAASWSAFFLGQWIVPGAFAVLLLMLAIVEIRWADNLVLLVSALSAPSGLALGGRHLALGVELLARADGVQGKARRTARWSLVHNGLLIAAMAGAALVDGDSEAFVLAAGSVLWAFVSIGHAVLLLSAARAIDRHGEREWLPEALPRSG